MGAEAPLAPRVFLARYRMGPLLGRGGMAEVYDGYDERLHRPVAVKVLRPEVAADPEVRTRFEIEARLAAGLSHPNVVAVFDTGEDDGTPFIVMERLPGETLADRMATGPVDQVWLRRMAGDVLGALGAAHAAGLVHRDVKPGNILLAEDGCAKVADFGIAKSLEVTGGDLTGTGLLFGTPAYLAPERLEGHPATERSDLYALGVVLYEALAGAKPFDGPTPVAVADAVLHAAPAPLIQARPDLDPAFASAVEQSMSRDPSARPGSARAMARALQGTGATLSQDPTVALPGDLPGPDATLVGAPGLVSPPAGDAAHPLAGDEGSAPVGPSPDGRMSPAMRVALVAAGALLVVLVVLALAGGGSDGGGDRTALVADIHDLAGRVKTGDGPSGPEAADRLNTIGDHVKAGGGADEANALLADAALWTQQGQLSVAATQAMATLLAGIDGVDPSLATATTLPTTTLAPTTVPPPPPDEGDQDGDRDRGKKRGKDDD